MLAHFDVVVLNAPQRIAIRLARNILAAGRRPRGRGDLDYESVARVIPGQHAFRMAPRCAAFLGAPGNLGVVVKLVVPDHIVEGTVINLVEGGAQRVGGGVAHAIAAQLQDVVLAAGIGKLLAE